MKEFLKDLGETKQLTKEEEYKLWENWHYDKCFKSRNELIISVLPFAIKLSNRFVNTYQEREDLVQVVTLALIEILRTWDARKARLTTYMHRKIYWFCQQNAYRNRTIALPRSALKNMDYVLEKLFTEGVLCIDCVPELEAEEEIEGDTEYFSYLRTIIDELPERLKRIINMRLEGKTLEAVAKELKVTKERIRQLELKAKAILSIKAKSFLRRER